MSEQSSAYAPSFAFNTVPPPSSLSPSPQSKAEIKFLRRRRKLRERIIEGKMGDFAPLRHSPVTSARLSRYSSYSIPPGLFLLTFLLSLSLLVLPNVVPHSPTEFTKRGAFLKYTLPGITSEMRVGDVVGWALLWFTVVGMGFTLLPRSVTKPLKKFLGLSMGIVQYVPFFLIAVVAGSVARFYFPNYISQVRSFLSPSLRYCAPANDRISSHVATHLERHGLARADSCRVADLVYLPVPWIERAHVPGSSFGGVHRGARVNQIPYGDSRVAHKSTFNWNLKEAPFYPATFITEKDEVEILRAENRANRSCFWVVKAGEGRAKRSSQEKLQRSVWFGERPYEGIAWLKGIGREEERATRKIAVAEHRERIDNYYNEEKKEKAKNDARRRQKTDLSRSEVTERFLEMLGKEGVGEEEAKEWTGAKGETKSGGSNQGTGGRSHYLVQKHITNPLLVDGYKWSLRVPVLITAVEPLRFYIGKDAALAEYANEKFGDGGKSGWYTKDGRVEAYSGTNDNSRWEHVTDAIFEVVFGSVKAWKEDLDYSADLLIPAGSRPRGGGLGLDVKDAEAIEKRYKVELKGFRDTEVEKETGQSREENMKEMDVKGEKHKVSFQNAEKEQAERSRGLKSVDLSDVDKSSINGGGFHIFYFDFLFDDEGGVWLLDVDSLGGEEGGIEEGFETIVEDTLYVAGWLGTGEDDRGGGDYFERLLEGRNLQEAEEMQDIRSDVYICDMYRKHNKVGSGILCNLRLRELRMEQKRGRERGNIWNAVHPTMKTCGALLKAQGEMAMLDAAQCSATIAEGLREEEGNL